ncbi:DUF3732 domain-containing protein [Achromobacter deleyi]|uniref:DUF3732 domain-containing protein n=1 Tax=Achromobacter deleyi TaxID=1353891 RepID=UPI001465533D|nr:DUF3732 domain-containing protein [Achromobacter deleyi]CAB3837483.1 hypothetical protein LMG3412_01071 [Achromobacter deleyi]
MTRWNVEKIFFIGVSGQRRTVNFVPDSVNIITGASGTGKSTLIKAIDYCLGSSLCELPAHVRRRAVAVGVKWVSGEIEMIIGRIIPPVGQATSTRMFAAAGRNLALPESVDSFDGSTTVAAAKAFIERAFGIGDLSTDPSTKDMQGRATVRHATPYLFVTKEVIYSESTLLHGLEQADKARDIVAAMPYFLRATDEASAIDERRLRVLQRTLEREEGRERTRRVAETRLKLRAASLLNDSRRLGLSDTSPSGMSEAELLQALEAIGKTDIEATTYPDQNELGKLNKRRRQLLYDLGTLRRQSQATRAALSEAAGFRGVVERQRDKLQLVEHLHLEDDDQVCPICNAPSDRGRQTAVAIKQTLMRVRAESVAVERVMPRLAEHDQAIEHRIEQLNTELRSIDDQIKSWIRQSDETRRLADLGQLRAHLLGRISLFLETSVDERRQFVKDLEVLRDEIAQLNSRVDREAKEIRLRRAEARISHYASEAFAVLPTVAPCIGSELDFSARQPEVAVIEAESGAVLRMPDVGSDQNYLAIHIALSFALQHYFEKTEAPVPGLLILDQISRPYFPQSGDDADEAEISGREEDEDVQAMRRHIDFLFAETARREGLQVILLEHAYFADDSRYVKATRERWTRLSGNALIPLDWPTRMDD